MEHKINVIAIGEVTRDGDMKCIRIFGNYISGLARTEGFSHLQIIWWGHLADDPEKREKLLIRDLFKRAPDPLGVFSTRAPARPNPIMISTIQVSRINFKEGIIHTPFIDAEPGSPVLDIKPYFPMERVKSLKVPDWCEHWPQWADEVESFNWNAEMNIQQ
jgi:tRNA (Thr-GGU) A37 N-methylase